VVERVVVARKNRVLLCVGEGKDGSVDLAVMGTEIWKSALEEVGHLILITDRHYELN
jgi:hypothetical protein